MTLLNCMWFNSLSNITRWLSIFFDENGLKSGHRWRLAIKSNQHRFLLWEKYNSIWQKPKLDMIYVAVTVWKFRPLFRTPDKLNIRNGSLILLPHDVVLCMHLADIIYFTHPNISDKSHFISLCPGNGKETENWYSSIINKISIEMNESNVLLVW